MRHMHGLNGLYLFFYFLKPSNPLHKWPLSVVHVISALFLRAPVELHTCPSVRNEEIREQVYVGILRITCTPFTE